jgi:uncharacterized OB-fold protein
VLRDREGISLKIYNENGKLTGIACNCCGKIVLLEQDILKNDFASFRKEWGYFSGKDGVVHSFELCEECYDRIVG